MKNGEETGQGGVRVWDGIFVGVRTPDLSLLHLLVTGVLW